MGRNKSHGMNKMQISRLLRGGLFTSHKTNKIYNSPMGQEVDLMSCKRQLPEVLGQQYLLGVVVDAKLPIHIIFLFCDDICFNTHTHTHTHTSKYHFSIYSLSHRVSCQLTTIRNENYLLRCVKLKSI